MRGSLAFLSFPRPSALWGIGAVAVFLLAAALRLLRPDLTDIGGDELTTLLLAADLLDGKSFPLQGLASSTGLSKGPLPIYYVALAMLVSRDPAVISGIIALMDLLGVILCYWFVQEYFGKRAALLAALFYGTSLWALIIARKIWDVAFVGLLMVLVLSSLFSLIVKRKGSSLAWLLLWLTVMYQVHPSAIAVIFFVAVALLLYRPPLRPAFLLLGVLLSLISAAPYLYGRLLRPQSDVTIVSRFAQEPLTLDLVSLHYAWTVLLPSPDSLILTATSGHLVAQSPLVFFFRTALIYLFMAGVGYGAVLALVRGPLKPAGGAREALLVLAFVLPILFYAPHTYRIFRHYVFELIPVMQILFAVALDRWAYHLQGFLHRLQGAPGPAPRPLGPLFSGGLLGACGLFWAGVQVYLFLTLVNWLDVKGSTYDYGVPLIAWQRAMAKAEPFFAEASPHPVHVVGHGILSDLPEYLGRGRYIFTKVDDRQALALPRVDGAPLVYATTSDHTPAGRFLREHFGSYEAASSALTVGEDVFRVYRLPPSTRDELLALPGATPLSFSLSNGIRLHWYALPQRVRAGTPLPLAVAWSVENRPPAERGRSYQFFNHVVDHRGATWGQADGIGYPTGMWQPGDLVVSWFSIPVREETPLGRYWLDLGMYDPRTLQRVTLASPPHQPGDHLLLGPFKVELSAQATPSAPELAYALPPDFAGVIQLIGYSWTAKPPGSGQNLELLLYWGVRGRPGADFTLFLHLLDQEGRLVAQEDEPPLGGHYPTSWWEPGEILEDRRSLPLPTALPPGRYTLRLGLYDATSMERLPVRQGGEAPADRSFTLRSIDLAP